MYLENLTLPTLHPEPDDTTLVQGQVLFIFFYFVRKITGKEKHKMALEVTVMAVQESRATQALTYQRLA